MRHGGRNIKLSEIADYLTASLTAAGVDVFRMESESTRSIYLKIDYGVCNTIRISDHYSRKCRYNIGPYISHFKVEHFGRYDRYYYQSKRYEELTRRILKDRRTLLRRYGKRNYMKYLHMNKEKYHECK